MAERKICRTFRCVFRCQLQDALVSESLSKAFVSPLSGSFAMHFAKAGWFCCGLSCDKVRGSEFEAWDLVWCYWHSWRSEENAEILRCAQNDKLYNRERYDYFE